MGYWETAARGTASAIAVEQKLTLCETLIFLLFRIPMKASPVLENDLAVIL
jgi:hypothetical protein